MPQAPPPTPAGTRVLLATPDPVRGEQLRLLLAQVDGLRVSVADPSRLKDIAREDRPELLLVDGRPNGTRAAPWPDLRDLGLPVLVLTPRAAYSRPGRNELNEAYPTLLEPFEAEDVENAIRTARALHGLRREVADSGHKVREALRQGESRYRAVVESQTEFIVRWTPDGVRTFVNDAYARYFGVPREDLVGTSFFPLISNEAEREAVRRRIAALTPASPVMMNVHQAVSSSGELRWQEWVDRGLFDGSGRLVELQSVGRDVHDRVVAEDDLRRSEERFRAIFDQAFQFTGLLTADGTLIEANRTALDFIGASLDEVVGVPFWDTPWWSHSAESREQLRRDVRAAAAGELVRHEVTHIAPTGRVHTLDFSLKPVRDAAGDVVLLIPEGRDVTELRQLEEQLRQALKMQAIGQVAGGVAHDFNNLLTIISASLDLLELELEHPAQSVRESLGEIRDAGDRAALMTRQLLAFSRKQALEPRVLDLNELVVRSKGLLERLIGRNVTFRIDLEQADVSVRVDPGQMEQVLLNLTINARDAMAGEGTLHISTRRLVVSQPERRGHRTLPPGDYVILTVRDTGCGMPENLKSRIFEPFFTTKEATEGTGLGLSTVYGIVEQSGGMVTVESELGVGSTFEVYLPLYRD